MKTGLSGRGARSARAATILLSLLSLSSLPAAIVQTVTPKADAYVRSAMDKKGFGFEAQLDLRMNAKDGASEGYVQFPLPQHAPFAEKIVLRIYAQLAEPGAAKVLVRSVNASNWTELGLTWRTRPEHKETLGTLNIVGLSGAWYEADVTAFAKAEAALGRESVTLALVPGEETKNRITVRTHESTQNKPELVFSRPPISARISFINTNSVPVEGFLADQGDVFGPRTNGFTYGWSVDNRDYMRDRRDWKNTKLKSPSRAHDFLAYLDHEKMKSPPGKLANMHAELGASYAALGLSGDAAREYSKALDLCPEFADLRVQLANVYRDMGMYNAAIAEFEQAKRSKPDYHPARINLGVTYYSLGRRFDALAEWHEVLKADPENKSAKLYIRMVDDANPPMPGSALPRNPDK